MYLNQFPQMDFRKERIFERVNHFSWCSGPRGAEPCGGRRAARVRWWWEDGQFTPRAAVSPKLTFGWDCEAHQGSNDIPRLSHLPKVTQLGGVREGTWTGRGVTRGSLDLEPTLHYPLLIVRIPSPTFRQDKQLVILPFILFFGLPPFTMANA